MSGSSLSLSSANKISVFSEINPVPNFFFFFDFKSFLGIGPLTVKVRKKFLDQMFGYIRFCFEIRAHVGHLFARTLKIVKFNR